jgi:hypothetical protein
MQQTAKRVQIIAAHDGPFRRQLVHKLRIAMIDEVEQIELVTFLF